MKIFYKNGECSIFRILFCLVYAVTSFFIGIAVAVGNFTTTKRPTYDLVVSILKSLVEKYGTYTAKLRLKIRLSVIIDPGLTTEIQAGYSACLAQAQIAWPVEFLPIFDRLYVFLQKI